MTKKHIQQKFNILTMILLTQFWVDNVYRLKVKIYTAY